MHRDEETSYLTNNRICLVTIQEKTMLTIQHHEQSVSVRKKRENKSTTSCIIPYHASRIRDNVVRSDDRTRTQTRKGTAEERREVGNRTYCRELGTVRGMYDSQVKVSTAGRGTSRCDQEPSGQANRRRNAEAGVRIGGTQFFFPPLPFPLLLPALLLAACPVVGDGELYRKNHQTSISLMTEGLALT